MARIETWFNQDLKEAVKVRYLDGNVFSADNQGNIVGVHVFDNGEPATIGGTVSASIIRADGATVAQSGSVSGNDISVVLPETAYAVPGPISVVLKLTQDGNTTTLLAVVANVFMSSTDTAVDPGTIIPSIAALIAEIDAAVATIPADYSTLWATIAPVFSSSTSYHVGQYVTYDGGLYQFIHDHSGTWAAGDVVAANVGCSIYGLGKTIEAENDILYYGKQHTFINGYFQTPADGEAVTYSSASTWVCTIFPVTPGERIFVNVSASAGVSRYHVFIDSSGNAIGRAMSSATGRRVITAPEGAVYVAVNNNLSVQAENYFAISGEWEKNLYDITEVEQGSYSGTNGTPGNSTAYSRTILYKITDIDEIVMPAVSIRFIYRYDGSKNYIDRVSDSAYRALSQNQFIETYGGGSVVYVAISEHIGDTTTPEDVIASGFAIRTRSNKIVTDKIAALEEMTKTELVDKQQAMYRFADYEQGGLTTTGGEGTSFYYCRTGYINISNIDSIYKPTGVFMIVCLYDSSKTFLERITKYGSSSSATLNVYDIKREFGYSGETAFIRFAVERFVDENAVESLPSDIVASGLIINVVGASEDIYQQIVDIKSQIGAEGNGTLPSYYEPYITTKINAINGREDSASVNSDNLIFITDYHFTKNAQNSPMLIRKIVEETGISKLFFGGDAGVSAPLASMYRAARDNGKIYQKLWDSAPQFYGMLGNHEWNDHQDETHEAAQQAEVFSRAGVVSFYLNKEEQIVKGMSVEGNYYIDNVRAKIRYFVLQATGQAKISNETAKWLGDQLGEVPNGWYVVVMNHYAYTGGTTGTDSMTGRGNLSVLRIAQLLGALKNHTTVTINQYANTGGVTGTYSFDYTGKSVTPICILSGHTHWDASLTISQSDYGILTIATTCDAFGYAQSESTHESEPRQVGTTDEQAFDVVQIDLDARTVYMTRIGGGSDRDFTF